MSVSMSNAWTALVVIFAAGMVNVPYPQPNSTIVAEGLVRSRDLSICGGSKYEAHCC